MTDATVEREPMNDVETALLRVGCARFDDQVAHEDFVTLVNTLVDAVRTDERAIAERAKAAAAPPAIKRQVKATRESTDADVLEIKRRAAATERGASGRLPKGWAAAVAVDLGLTYAQVQKALHR